MEKGKLLMGEYATIKSTGQQVKIGTCESLYYLRADQAELITPDPRQVDIYRYRFPFPDEDERAIEDMMSVREFERGVSVYGVRPPAELEHYSVQFRNEHIGYNVCLPCPESHSTGEEGFGPIDVDGLKVHRNGFRGAVQLVSQRLKDGKLMLVLRCACGSMWRLETLEDAQPVIDSFIAEAERQEHQARVGPHFRNADGTYDEAGIAYQGEWHRKIAERIRAGYER